MTTKHIPFGVFLQGPGINMNAWKDPSVPADASSNFAYYVEKARKAERAGMEFAFIADGLYIHEKSLPHFLNRLEPLTLLGALAAATSRIGLVGTVSTSYSEPFTVARQLASLDFISNGRIGWNSVTSPLEGSGKNYGKVHPTHADRYEIAAEYLEVVAKLWDSWEDDAFPRDRATGRYFDPSKMHRAQHNGQYFNVEGPLNIGRSVQGHPVIFQAGSSDAGIDLAGRYADAVFTNGGTFEECQAFCARVKKSALKHGRSADHVKVFPGIGPIVGKTAEEAKRKHDRICDLTSIEDSLTYLSHFFAYHDFSQYPLDEPFPELGDLGNDGFRYTSDSIKQRAREKKQTLREVARETVTLRAPIGTSDALIGTPAKIADELIRWIDGDAADGFMLGFPVVGSGLDDFIELVLPELARRGYHNGEAHGTSLREHLGVPYRASRYAAAEPVAAQ